MNGATPSLNRKLTLESPARSPDGSGGFEEAWVALGELWAEIKAHAGSEADTDGLATSLVPYSITVRAAPLGDSRRPRPEQRFREGARVFRILAVADADPDSRYLVCRAREEEVTT